MPVRLFSISHTFTRTASGTSLTFTDFVALYNSMLKTLYSNFTNSISDNCT